MMASPTRPEGKCPHANIIHCPLYLAAHIANAGGCDDGRLGEGGCAVDRGMNYRAGVEAFRAKYPREVAECEFAEAAAQAAAQADEQRARNMRLSGVHR